MCGGKRGGGEGDWFLSLPSHCSRKECIPPPPFLPLFLGENRLLGMLLLFCFFFLLGGLSSVWKKESGRSERLSLVV